MKNYFDISEELFLMFVKNYLQDKKINKNCMFLAGRSQSNSLLIKISEEELFS